MNEDRTAVRDFVADRWDEKEKETPAATAPPRTEAPSRAVAPARARSRSNSLEPGELPASQPKASKVVASGPKEKGKEKESTDGDYVELGTGKMTMRVKRFMKRLDEVENDVLETSERQDQIESMVEEMVRQEVETQVQAFRTKRSERKARDEQKAQQGPDPEQRQAAGENSIPPMPRENGDNHLMIEAAEHQGARVMPAQNGVSQGTIQQAQDQRQVKPPPRHARDEEPGMTREVALAFIESMRQEMRQEFDTKLYEQAKAHERALQDAMGQTTASVYRDLQTLTAMMAKHRDVLGNHGEAARRHEQILQGLLGTLSNIPRPHNVP